MSNYICQCCGLGFNYPQTYIETHGECYGFPARERVTGCPFCGGSYENAKSVLQELGGNTGRNLEH